MNPRIDKFMKNRFIFCLIIFLLSACVNVETPENTPSLDDAALNQTAVSRATADFELTQAILPTQTLASIETWTPIPTLDRTRPPVQTPTTELTCNMAAAGHPIDVTIPDGTVMAPGESFSKTWRLENVGRCTWTPQYILTYFSGNSMEALQIHNLPAPVEPGEMIDLSVDMKAPLTPGMYQSNWMLRDPGGELFGIGPNGDAPFWVQIEVVESITATPEPTPTVTRTPVVYLTGQVQMVDQDQLDLDSATLNPEDVTQVDFVYQYSDEPAHILMTMNGLAWVIIGDSEPSFGDCVVAERSGDALSFSDIPVGSYACYQTSGELLGWLVFNAFEDGQLSISFLTWSTNKDQ